MNDVYSVFPLKLKNKRNSKYKKFIPFLSKHPRLKYLIDIVGPIQHEVPIWSSIDDAVLYSVIGQMLSGSASCSIIKNLIVEFGSSSSVIHWAERNAHKNGPLKGVSQRKRKTLREWALYKRQNGRIWKNWSNMPLTDYREEINKIWGFGRWSADMIAIFYLGRMDVWPETDGGILKACKAVFGTDEYSRLTEYIKGCETVTALYLWELINKKLIHHFGEISHG